MKDHNIFQAIAAWCIIFSAALAVLGFAIRLLA
jgi:hypothetical protein